MSRIWKFFFVLAVALVAAGAVLAVAGIVTGASFERMAGIIFGGVDQMKALIDLVVSEIKAIF